MSGMDQILQINGEHLNYIYAAEYSYIYHIPEADSDLVCQSGARWEDINEILKERGIPLFFPVGASLPSSKTTHSCFLCSWIQGQVL